MKHFSTSSIILSVFCLVLCNSCNNNSKQNESSGFDIEFDVLDKDANSLDVSIRLHYSIATIEQRILISEYGKNFKELVLVPTLKSSTRNVLIKFSAAEIYNYKRQLAEKEIIVQVKTEFSKYGVELNKLMMSSVKLPLGLKRRLEAEHNERMSEY